MKIKIVDIKTNAIKEVEKSLASDFIGTGKFKLYEEKESKIFYNEDLKKPVYKKYDK